MSSTPCDVPCRRRFKRFPSLRVANATPAATRLPRCISVLICHNTIDDPPWPVGGIDIVPASDRLAKPGDRQLLTTGQAPKRPAACQQGLCRILIARMRRASACQALADAHTTDNERSKDLDAWHVLSRSLELMRSHPARCDRYLSAMIPSPSVMSTASSSQSATSARTTTTTSPVAGSTATRSNARPTPLYSTSVAERLRSHPPKSRSRPIRCGSWTA